jgi:hypothetical protein
MINWYVNLIGPQYHLKKINDRPNIELLLNSNAHPSAQKQHQPMTLEGAQAPFYLHNKAVQHMIPVSD